MVFPFEYVGGGYFRQKGIPKGEVAVIIHGPLVVEIINQLLEACEKAVEDFQCSQVCDGPHEGCPCRYCSTWAAIKKATDVESIGDEKRSR